MSVCDFSRKKKMGTEYSVLQAICCCSAKFQKSTSQNTSVSRSSVEELFKALIRAYHTDKDIYAKRVFLFQTLELGSIRVLQCLDWQHGSRQLQCRLFLTLKHKVYISLYIELGLGVNTLP